jgi:biotin carboxyl carrier protein
MERKFKITVDGRQYNVSVEELAELNNAEPAAIVAPLAPYAPPAAPAPSIPAAAVARGPAEPGDIVSPLNGVVASAPVSVGQQVGEGECILVLEAMKMKTPITAKRAGTVSAILVNVGDGVEVGQVLAKIA